MIMEGTFSKDMAMNILAELLELLLKYHCNGSWKFEKSDGRRQ